MHLHFKATSRVERRLPLRALVSGAEPARKGLGMLLDDCHERVEAELRHGPTPDLDVSSARTDVVASPPRAEARASAPGGELRKEPLAERVRFHTALGVVFKHVLAEVDAAQRKVRPHLIEGRLLVGR